MIKELTNSIKATLYQRISSPLYGTYILSWLLYNWQATLPLLFGSKRFDERLVDFKAILIVGENSFVWCSLIAPMLITIAILLLQPLIQRYLYVYSEWNKSEGLKKRDKFSAETMLTLEQSNELRASVQKVQQFHQEIVKNKDEEITEYKRQLEARRRVIDEQTGRTAEYIEKLSKADSEKSELSAELATLKGGLENTAQNYKRLASLLSRQRNRTREIRQKLTPIGWYASRSLISEFPALVEVEVPFDGKQYKERFEKLLALSSDKKWAHTCYKLMIDGFGSSWNYDMADNYFDLLIKPYLKDFDTDNLTHLRRIWELNSQINERRRAGADLDLIDAIIKASVA